MAGETATTFAVTPSCHYHPNAQAGTVTKDGSSRILTCPDLRGLAALSGTSFAAATVGPAEMTDGLGRKFWRFTGADYLLIANTLNTIAARGLTVFMAGRMHKHKGPTVNFFSPRYNTYTDDATNTTYAGGSSLRSVVLSSAAPVLYGAGIGALTDATNGKKIIPGCQMCVWGVASRTTANGGQRLYLNNDVAVVAQSGGTQTGCVGGVIGGVPAASNAVTASGNWFDLYELAIWNSGTITNGQADAMAAAQVTNFGIAAITEQVILLGDSITDAIATALPVSPTSADNPGMMLCDPGASHVASSCRVLNFGTSGNQTSHLATLKDAINSILTSSFALPGGPSKNKIIGQIGRNDVGAGGKSAATVYIDVVTLTHSATPGQEGLLERGFDVTWATNIASGVSVQAILETYRALIADAMPNLPTSTFLADCLAGSGQAFEGLLHVLHLHEVTVGGNTAFKTVADASDTASGWYNTDQTHLRLAGVQLMVSGGDTPQYGYASLNPAPAPSGGGGGISPFAFGFGFQCAAGDEEELILQR